MKDWKTTLFGFLAVIPATITALTPALPPKWAAVLTAISGAIAMYFAKDKPVT
jgi:hypothetical protein